MKQKVINVLSWASVIVIIFAVGMSSFMAGVCVVNYLADAMGIAGTWWAFALVPVLFAVGFGAEAFLLLGLKRFGTTN